MKIYSIPLKTENHTANGAMRTQKKLTQNISFNSNIARFLVNYRRFCNYIVMPFARPQLSLRIPCNSKTCASRKDTCSLESWHVRFFLNSKSPLAKERLLTTKANQVTLPRAMSDLNSNGTWNNWNVSRSDLTLDILQVKSLWSITCLSGNVTMFGWHNGHYIY